MPFKIGDEEYTFDVGVPDGQGGALPANSTGTPALGESSDFEGKDLSKPTKLTLSQYMSDVTTGKAGSSRRPNKYPVDRNASYAEAAISVDGIPAALADSKNSASFTSRRDEGGLNALSDDAAVLSKPPLLFRRGVALGQASDGNSLLAQPDSVASAYTSVVLNRNRFTPATRDAEPIQPSLDGAQRHSVLPAKLPERGGALTGNLTDARARDVSPGRLATVGATLSLRGSRELTSNEPGADPNSTGSTAAALLPSPAQLVVSKVSSASLRARSVVDSLTSEESNASLNVVDDSWGHMNNVADAFAGVTAIGVGAIAIALGASIVTLVNALSAALCAGKQPRSQAIASRDSIGRYALGRRVIAQSGLADAMTIMGINGTVFPFMRALRVGTNAFFGIEDPTVRGFAASAARVVADSPGFYAVVARSLVRSGATIVDRMKSIGGNPVDVAKQVIGLAETIRSSRIVAAINAFAQLGDQILSHDDRTLDASNNHPARLSTVDSYTDDSTPAVSKSRLKDSLKLAWASNRAHALYLLPSSLDSAMLRGGGLGAFSSGADSFEEKSLSRHRHVGDDELRTAGPMIPVDEALELERRLDAEYVPFYFKDLRTREIVAFHAFLASLSDDYSANWDESDGFGRIDSVGAYKNTKRKVGLSFYVVATSPTDFDEMWVKVNKLVTLVYPQYSAGKTISADVGEGYRFTQPFSQLVSASPIVRLRLGDLLTSNYSRFALARLFGLGSPGLKLDGTEIATRQRPAAFAAKLAVAKRNPSYAMRLKPGLYPAADDAGLFGGLNPIPLGVRNAPVLDVTSMGEFFDVTYVTEHSSGDGRVIVKVKLASDLARRYPKIYEYVKDEHDNEGRPLIRYVDGFYTVPISALDPTPETMRKIMSELDPGGDDGSTQKISEFMDPRKNAVVRSFRSAGGKGLAGRIDSLGFDWYDRAQWDTSPGRCAPMMCKVSVSFTPIHDISPGIDHQGFNRGPVYPVGRFMAHGDDELDGRLGVR